MQLIPQYTRITNYKKLVDRFITSQVRSSSDPKKQEMGKIFALIEILNPWHPNAQIGQTIINTLIREYYRQSNTNELINLENALKKVNEKLVEITQRGETDWIGKINATLILITNNKIHLAYTGKIKAYLWRSGKILPIINPKETYTYNHPLKTFSSVISGDLKLKDKIFFSTNLLFDFIDSHKLEQLLSEKNIIEIGDQIASILRSRNTKQANCIIVDMGITNQDLTQMPEAIYLDQEQFAQFSQTFKKYFDNLKDSGAKLGLLLKNSFGKSQKYYQEKIVPKSKEILTKSKSYTEKHISKPTIDETKIRSTIPNSPEQSKPSLNVNYYNASSKKIVLYFKKCLDYLSTASRKIINLLKKCFKPKNRSKTFIVISIILLLIFIANIGLLKKVNTNKENIIQTEAILTDLENKKDDASLAIITGDNKKAEVLLNEIMTEINNLQYDPSLNNRVDSLKNEIQEKLDEISKITRLTDPQSINEFNNTNFFTISSNKIISLNTSSNQIFASEIKNNASPSEIAQIPTQDGLAKTMSQQENTDYIYTFKKSVYSLQNDNLKKVTNKDGSWKNAAALANYLENIYLLDSDIGQIYKYTKNNDNFSESSEYLDTNKIDVKKSIDLTIDGNIYILKSDGNIIKILLGNPINFTINGIPEPDSNISNPKKIYTEEGINSLYVLDNNRILELDKNGNYISQFAFSNDISDIKDFYINPKNKELYILDNNKVYSFNY